MRPCYLHIGTHKTGTKSIQHFLADHAEALLEAGLFYPKTGRDQGLSEDDHCAHHRIPFDMLHYGLDVFSAGGVATALAAEIRGRAAPAVVLSSESFANVYLRTQVLGRFQALLRDAGYVPKIVVYLRPQTNLAEALYATVVISNDHVEPFDDFVERIVRDGCVTMDGVFYFEFDYERLLEPFESAFGSENLIVRPYRRFTHSDELLREFLDIVGAPAGALLGQGGAPKYNESKRYGAVLDGLARNMHLGESGRDAVLALLEHLGETPEQVDNERFAPASATLALRMHDRLSASNRRLAERYGVVIPTIALDDAPADSAEALSALRRGTHLRRLFDAAIDRWRAS